MDLTEKRFISVIASLFTELPAPMQLETPFRDLEEWSSMQALIVIATVDEQFGVTLPEKEFRKARTVGDLYRITVSRTENG